MIQRRQTLMYDLSYFESTIQFVLATFVYIENVANIFMNGMNVPNMF